MRHLGLFEGIGGFALAARSMGWYTAAWCEWSPFCQASLRYHFPEAEGFGDITKSDFIPYAGSIDILTGGFPCQPFSTAGKQLGTADPRHLWPEMLRVIREVRPRWVVGENVHGLVSWSRGLVFDSVLADLENEGFEVWPVILPACGVNAPHRRNRIWFIAHAVGNGYGNESGEDRQTSREDKIQENKRERVRPIAERVVSSGPSPNAQCFGQPGPWRPIHPGSSKANSTWKASWSYDDGRWPTESPLCSGDDGLPGRLAGITVSKHQEESLKAYGNAIVPQVALQIFKTIEQFERLQTY